ncbi:hypothetical protein M513_11239 [Trichuris suis]|uniref:Uncharacterized protein n=1 Tax=Trichuris suis TaxID=68888 RepID=A0A085LSE0_9BILA|nr:hypothetical protein M513_11239 [Trichuris suis]
MVSAISQPSDPATTCGPLSRIVTNHTLFTFSEFDQLGSRTNSPVQNVLDEKVHETNGPG